MTVTYFVLALTFFVSVQSAEWSYKDPATWGKNFKSCDGASQSPINLISVGAKYDSQLDDFELRGFETTKAHTIVNNGHTVQLNIGYSATSQDGGLPGTYKALQFHFHWSANKLTAGSEHTMNGKAHPLEVHIVHMNTAYGNVSEALKHPDGLAVLGFFFKVGDPNPAIAKFINKVPGIGQTATSEPFSISDLLGSLGGLDDYYRYQGSLTTPPCSEAVVWTVFDKFLTISKEQLKAFWAIQDHHGDMISNYRPLQKLNGRTIYTSIKSSAWHYEDTDAWGVEYPDCKKDAQSPINIITSDVTTGNFGPIKMFRYSGNQYFNMINNGHSLQLGFAKRGSYIMNGGLTNMFQALQFHFHWDTLSKISGSEHQINGKAFPLEMHIVHKNVNYTTIEEALDKSDGLAVLGFLFKLSKKANPEMDKFINIAKTIKDGSANVSLDLGKLIGLKDGSMADFYRYKGSLTTPPCSQAVIWSIFRKPIYISPKQLKQIWKVRGRNNEDLHNFRPVRPMNGRTVSFTA